MNSRLSASTLVNSNSKWKYDQFMHMIINYVYDFKSKPFRNIDSIQYYHPQISSSGSNTGNSPT